jgi:hypothetical protein
MAILSTDPICFARDANSDVIIPLRIVRGIEAVEVMVRCALNLWRDEWFLNRDIGMPMLPTTDGVVGERDAILGQPHDPNKIGRALRTELLALPGVKAIKSLQTAFDGEARNLTIRCVVTTAFGDTPEIAVSAAA